MSQFSVINAYNGYDLSVGFDWLYGVWKSGIAVASMTAATQLLKGRNRLDGNEFTIPEGRHFSAGPEGEIMPLVGPDGSDTFRKLYDPTTSMDFPEAYEAAKSQGANLVPLEKAQLALGLLCWENPGVVIPQLRYMRSKGKGRMGLFTFSGYVCKPSWFDPKRGPGSAVQAFAVGDAWYESEITKELYVINKAAILQWASKLTGGLIAKKDESNAVIMQVELPKVHLGQVQSCVVSQFADGAEAEAKAIEFAMQQRKLLGLDK
jgi:hypothetical protein